MVPRRDPRRPSGRPRSPTASTRTLDREDDDCQVLLQYDVTRWARYEQPLSRQDPHTSGPRSANKLFVCTGVTHFGVQNLEYDAYTGSWMTAVYTGQKPQFPNYSLLMVSGDAEPDRQALRGQPRNDRGDVLPLLEQGLHDPTTGIRGRESAGNHGLESLGDGTYYIATGGPVLEDGVAKQDAHLTLHHWTGQTPTPFAPYEAAH